MTIFKPILAVLGLGAALAAGPVAADITWSPPLTLFEDDDIDFLYTEDSSGNLVVDTDGTIDQGDVLIAVVEMDRSGGSLIGPDIELTGLAVIQVDSVGSPDFLGNALMSFEAYAGGFNKVLDIGTLGLSLADGDALGGAMFALWVDDTPDLGISADAVTAGTVSCTSLSACIDQATDGSLWEVDGFTGVDGSATGDEFWFANAPVDTSTVENALPSTVMANFNAGLSILVNGTGQEVLYNSVSCFPFCGAGTPDDGFVDVSGSGTINGGLGLSPGLTSTGAFGTSDFQFAKSTTVPEPGTLALLGVGLLGFSAAQQRNRHRMS